MGPIMGGDLIAFLALALIFGLIPLLIFISSAFNRWVKFKSTQDQLGASTHELEKTVQRLEAERANLVRRVETLEAIVTSEEWDALREGEPPLSLDELPSDSSEPGRRTRQRTQS